MKVYEAVSKPALIATKIINDYVNWLGFDPSNFENFPTVGRGKNQRKIFAPRAEIGSTLTLTEDFTQHYRLTYFQDWMAALLKLGELNVAVTEGTAIDVAQNSRLGEILDYFSE